MEAPVIVVFVIVIIGFAVLMAVVQSKIAAERRAEMSTWAGARGWRYAERDDSFVDRFDSKLFDRGHSKRAINVVQGVWHGRPAVAMDYLFTVTTSNGKTSSSHTEKNSVVALNLGSSVPSLSVEPQGLVGGFFAQLLGTDVEVGDAAFDDAFLVRSESGEYAREMLGEDMRRLMLATPSVAFVFDRDTVFCWEKGEHTPDSVDRSLEQLDQVIATIPASVRQRYRLTEPSS